MTCLANSNLSRSVDLSGHSPALNRQMSWLDQDWLSCTRRHVAPSTAMKMYAPYLQLVLPRALLCSSHAHNCTIHSARVDRIWKDQHTQ